MTSILDDADGKSKSKSSSTRSDGRLGSAAIAATYPNVAMNGVIGAGDGEYAGNDTNDEQPKMFFTTSDLITKMNSAMSDATNDNIDLLPSPTSNESPSPSTEGFELQRKLPDGTYRKADIGEMAAVDFQTKMKQAATMIANMNSHQKIEWAKHQRQMGNELFGKGEYKEAMDVYLTCLVAMDQSTLNDIDIDDGKEDGDEEDDGFDDTLNQQIETNIKLPVLLNLALSALKLGLLSKSEQFCNFALEMDSGKRSIKAHFRRGRVRMLMGHYITAELDLDKALELLNDKLLLISSKQQGGMEIDIDATMASAVNDEKRVIMKEKQKLVRLMNQADKHRKQQKKAMEKLFQTEDDGDLYPEKEAPTVAAVAVSRQSLKQQQQMQNEKEEDEYQYPPTTYFQWYMHMIGRCAQKLLDVIGDGEDDDELLNNPIDLETMKILAERRKEEAEGAADGKEKED